MDDIGLKRALGDSLTPDEWYRILNRNVFFWPTIERLETMRNARAYRGKPHTIIVIDTLRLLRAHLSKVLLSPINSGATKPFPHPRGRDTFLPLGDYPYQERKRARGEANAIAEVAVIRAVPDIKEFVISVEERTASSVPIILYP